MKLIISFLILISFSFVLAKDLAQLIEKGDLEGLKEFIEKENYDINKKDRAGFSLLHLASFYNKVEIADYLIKNGANVNAKGLQQRVALHWAFEKKNSSKLVKLLIENGADPNLKNRYEESPFHIACEYADPEIIKLMVEKGAHIHEKTHRKQTALHFAARGANLEAVKYLIKKGLDLSFKDDEGYTAFHRAVYHNYNRTLELIEYFIKIGDNLNSKNKYGYTVLQGIESLIHELVRKNKNDKHLSLRVSFIQLAIKELTKTLLGRKQLESNTQFDQKLHQIDSYFSSTEEYVQEVKDMIIKEWSPLHKAVFYLDFEKVKDLIEKQGVDLNKKDKNGWSALFVAYTLKDFKIADFLIEHGADIKTKDTSGNNMLHSFAGDQDKIEVLEELLNKGVSVNERNKTNGFSPLHVASSKDNSDAVKLFIKHGANVNLKSQYNKNTPLHEACLNASAKTVSYLLDHGADPYSKNAYGKTPLQFLETHKEQREEIKNILKNKMSETNRLNKPLNSLRSFANRLTQKIKIGK